MKMKKDKSCKKVIPSYKEPLRPMKTNSNSNKKMIGKNKK